MRQAAGPFNLVFRLLLSKQQTEDEVVGTHHEQPLGVGRLIEPDLHEVGSAVAAVRGA